MRVFVLFVSWLVCFAAGVGMGMKVNGKES